MVRKQISFLGHALDRIGAWATGLGVLAGFFAGLVAAMTWLGRKLSLFGPMPWPEAIFVGIGGAAVVVIAISIGLFAWRYFHPLATEEGAMSKNAAFDVETEIGLLTERVDKLADIVKNHGSDIVNRIHADRSFESRIEATEKAVTTFQAALENCKSTQRRFEDSILLALRARQAKELLNEIAASADLVGEKLLIADEKVYPTADDWVRDFNSMARTSSVILCHNFQLG